MLNLGVSGVSLFTFVPLLLDLLSCRLVSPEEDSGTAQGKVEQLKLLEEKREPIVEDATLTDVKTTQVNSFFTS